MLCECRSEVKLVNRWQIGVRNVDLYLLRPAERLSRSIHRRFYLEHSSFLTLSVVLSLCAIFM